MQNYNFLCDNISSLQEITIYSALKLNINQVKMMSEYDIPAHYYKYIPLFEEYLSMVEEGHKKSFVIAKLSDENHISESTVKRVIKALSRRVIV